MRHTFIALIVLLLSSAISAQDFQGIATYKSKRQLDIELDSTQMGGERYKQVMEMLKKQFENTHLLTFNKVESIYKEDEVLEAPQPSGMRFVVASTDGSDILYKNTKEERFTSQNEIMGKVFLIKDKLEPQQWNLGKDTKNIGDYTCYKATMTRQTEVVEANIRVSGDSDQEETNEPRFEDVTITAWYTPQIPVNNGPARYYGLPGLILEVNDGTETIICSKIVLNPKDKVKISEPDKGKLVSQEEYDQIMEKKMQEMEERFKNNREHSDDGNRMRIRIGG